MPMCILEIESILEQNDQGSLALLPHWLLLKVLEVKFVKIPKSLAPNDSDRKQAIVINK
jgi:hypothetical protein